MPNYEIQRSGGGTQSQRYAGAPLMTPGIHPAIPAATYHADPCPRPSLSSGIARLLTGRSPRHAWAAHPRLNTAVEPSEPTAAQEEGTLLHGLILGTDVPMIEVDADDWRGKVAQTARREARADGAIPILGWRLAMLERCVTAFREQLQHHECAAALIAGQPEASLVWREADVWCRARPDWLPDDPTDVIYDLKTTGGSADPATWERALREKYAMQAAFYMRGARALGLRPAGFVFLVIETDPPHGLCAFQADAALMGMAEERVEEAVETWRRCLMEDQWPGYPTRICTVEAPGWAIAKHEEWRIGLSRPRPDNHYVIPSMAELEQSEGFVP